MKINDKTEPSNLLKIAKKSISDHLDGKPNGISSKILNDIGAKLIEAGIQPPFGIKKVAIVRESAPRMRPELGTSSPRVLNKHERIALNDVVSGFMGSKEYFPASEIYEAIEQKTIELVERGLSSDKINIEFEVNMNMPHDSDVDFSPTPWGSSEPAFIGDIPPQRAIKGAYNGVMQRQDGTPIKSYVYITWYFDPVMNFYELVGYVT